MEWRNTLYISPLILSGIGTAVLAVYILLRHRSKPGARSLAALMAAVAVWSLLYALELGASDLPAKLFWAKLKYLALVAASPTWLVFALEYTGRGKWLTRRHLALLAVGAIATLLTVWTNDIHHLYWTDASLHKSGTFSTLSLPMGAGFWFWAAYSHSLMLLGALVISGACIRLHEPYRKQAGIMLIGAAGPWVGNIIFLAGLSPFPHLDPTPFAFMITCSVCALGLLRFRLLDIVPIAHEAIIESICDAILVLDAENRVVDINPAAESLIGLSASAAIGQPIARIWPSWPKKFECLHEATKGNHEIVLDDGVHQRFYQMHISFQPDERELPAYKILMLHDITERREWEEAFRASEANYRAIFDAANDAIFVHDIETGDIIDANQKMSEMYGYTPEEMRELSVETLSAGEPPYAQEDALRWMGKAAQGEPQLFEWMARDRQGGLFRVEVNLKRASIGGVDRLLAIVRDITGRKRAEEEIRASEQKYRTIFEESKDVVYLTTPEGRFLDINPAGVELFGYPSKHELLKIDLSRDLYVNPEDRKAFQEVIAEHGFVKDYELRLKSRDDKHLTVLATSNAVYDHGKNIVAYRGFMRDVTEQRQLEHQLLQAQKMESVGTLAGGIAHDFNNLLAGILGYASLIRSKSSHNQQLYNYAEAIERSASRAAELTSQLLAFARGGKYETAVLSLNRIIHETLAIVNRTFDKSIEVGLHANESLPTVEADAGQIQQVLLNLCLNARDAMDGQGKLTIETDFETITEDYAKSHPDVAPGSYVTLSVTDTGVGMDKETMQRAFEPFFTTKEPGKGTGLGLSMVYGIVKNHGGYLQVDSKLGAGSTFKIFFPVSGKTEARDPLGNGRQKGGDEMILVADDEEVVRSLAKDILEWHGYRVLLAEDGAEAIEVFKKHSADIDLVIADMAMPKLGGRDTLLKLRELNPKLKALLCTGYSTDDVAQEILDTGALGFVQKPYQQEQLLSKVRSALNTQVEEETSG
jgi:PAS domain S-box-containing protein